MKKIIFFVIVFLQLLIIKSYSQQVMVPFDTDKWEKQGSKETEFLGKKCLMGVAILKDEEFNNGVIEFDLAVNGERSYPGLVLRRQGQGNYERIYIRPHLSKIFQNVVQYEGTFNGIDSWQLYYGEGKTASATIPINQWFHIKLEVNGTQARFYINDMQNPVLKITNLARGNSKGNLGVWGPMDGSAYFANFSFRIDSTIQFPPIPITDNPYGVIRNWEISQPFLGTESNIEKYPTNDELVNMKWQKVNSLESGLVDVSRTHSRKSQAVDVIWAKTNINSEIDQIKQFAFGYSDIITIYLNGQLLFMGNSSYTSRDANFQGIIGFNDNIFFPLKKGNNELMIAVSESFGGWGFMFQDVNAIYTIDGLTKIWEIKNKFKYPESVVYDKKRDMLYVSNFTFENNGFISKVKINGEIEKQDWISGILQPSGLIIENDKLYVVGRYNMLEIDIDKSVITNRYPFPLPAFTNDIAADESGKLYVTDGEKGAIYKFENGKFIEWLTSDNLLKINGITFYKNKLYTGVSNDGSIKAIDLNTKEIKTIFSFGVPKIMDGILPDGNGNLLISDNDGRIFRISLNGDSELLLNTKARQINIADFEYIPEKKMFIIPTLYDNRLMIYKFK